MGIIVPSTWLRSALESDPEVARRLILVNGWETRGRPSSTGSYDPSGIVAHHTACMLPVGHDPANCLSVILNGNSVAPGPISQLLLTHTPPGTRWSGSNADPRIVLIAAGRCNHAGATDTYPWGAPGGNASSLGIEACGPGSHGWSDPAVDLYVRVIAAICRGRWHSSQVTTHHEVAPTRKIDPSGPWAGQRSLARLTPWDPDVLRARVSARLTSGSTAARRTLRVADRPRGEDVRTVQRRVGATVDGDYGPRTGEKVKAFKGFMMRQERPNTTWGAGAWRVHDWLNSQS